MSQDLAEIPWTKADDDAIDRLRRGLETKTRMLEAEHIFAVNLRILRTPRGWTQKHLGDLLGWSKSTVIRIETAKRSPSFVEVCLLADIFGVSLAEWSKDPSDLSLARLS